MDTKISDLTIDELKVIIRSTVHEAMEDFMEDIKALSNKNYIDSIKEAREDYKAGDYKDHKEVF